MPSRVAAPLHSVDIEISAHAAAIRLSLTTRVATGIAQSARAMLAISGLANASRNCCPWDIFTWSSACRIPSFP